MERTLLAARQREGGQDMEVGAGQESRIKTSPQPSCISFLMVEVARRQFSLNGDAMPVVPCSRRCTCRTPSVRPLPAPPSPSPRCPAPIQCGCRACRHHLLLLLLLLLLPPAGPSLPSPWCSWPCRRCGQLRSRTRGWWLPWCVARCRAAVAAIQEHTYIDCRHATPAARELS